MQRDPERYLGTERVPADDDRQRIGTQLGACMRDERANLRGKAAVASWLVLWKTREVLLHVEADDRIAILSETPRELLVGLPETDVVAEEEDERARWPRARRIEEQWLTAEGGVARDVRHRRTGFASGDDEHQRNPEVLHLRSTPS